jgi:hypothetical protein
VFYPDASTARYTWGAHCGAISGKQVPIPPGSHEAQGPGANTDHKYIVIDTDAKLVSTGPVPGGCSVLRGLDSAGFAGS